MLFVLELFDLLSYAISVYNLPMHICGKADTV